eukprot:4862962-Prymnesium_polylepis.1
MALYLKPSLTGGLAHLQMLVDAPNEESQFFFVGEANHAPVACLLETLMGLVEPERSKGWDGAWAVTDLYQALCDAAEEADDTSDESEADEV